MEFELTTNNSTKNKPKEKMKTVTKKIKRESFQVKDSSEDINDKDIEKEKEELLKAIRSRSLSETIGRVCQKTKSS